MLFNAGRNCKDIGVKNDIFRRKAHLLSQYVVGSFAYRDFACDGIGLPLLIERHHYNGGSVRAYFASLLDKCRLALLQADRVDDRFTLHAFKSRLDH